MMGLERSQNRHKVLWGIAAKGLVRAKKKFHTLLTLTNGGQLWMNPEMVP